MGVVYDRHEEEMKPLHDFLQKNKISFAQFIRTFNFIQNMSKTQLDNYIEAYKNGEFDNHGWY